MVPTGVILFTSGNDTSDMKIKVCDSPVYLHRIGKGIHIDIEHPIFVKIIERGDRAFCQGKGEHGIFIALNREMMDRADGIMAQTLEERFHVAWEQIVQLSREIGWERVQEMMVRAQQGVVEEDPGDQDEEP